MDNWKTYRPAANSVPLALPNVLIGISQASEPNMRWPNVTATASDSIISVFDIAARYEMLMSA